MKEEELRTEHIFQIINTLHIWLLALSPLMSPQANCGREVQSLQPTFKVTRITFFF